ncbi:MAG: TrmH family RNA methyltransferase [Candidatus Hermodarchaeota archaeon]
MILLIKLARFVTHQEQLKIQEQILTFFKFSSKISLKRDPWAAKYRLLLTSLHSLSPKTISELYTLPGVWEISILDEFIADSLSEVINVIKTYLTEHRLSSNQIFPKIRIFKNTAFHRQALLDRWRKKIGSVISESEATTFLYIEAKQNLLRIGKIVPQVLSPTPSFVPFTRYLCLVLERPTTADEISDFIRICISFNLPLRLVLSSSDASLLEAAKKRAGGRGFPKVRITTYQSISKAVAGTKAYGFSLWTTKNEHDLKKVFRNWFDSPHKISLVFGNEKSGLSLETRQKIRETIHLGPPSSEPLRASQAASYILGLMLGISLE